MLKTAPASRGAQRYRASLDTLRQRYLPFGQHRYVEAVLLGQPTGDLADIRPDSPFAGSIRQRVAIDEDVNQGAPEDRIPKRVALPATGEPSVVGNRDDS